MYNTRALTAWFVIGNCAHCSNELVFENIPCMLYPKAILWRMRKFCSVTSEVMRNIYHSFPRNFTLNQICQSPKTKVWLKGLREEGNKGVANVDYIYIDKDGALSAEGEERYPDLWQRIWRSLLHLWNKPCSGTILYVSRILIKSPVSLTLWSCEGTHRRRASG